MSQYTGDIVKQWACDAVFSSPFNFGRFRPFSYGFVIGTQAAFVLFLFFRHRVQLDLVATQMESLSTSVVEIFKNDEPSLYVRNCDIYKKKNS